MRLTLLSPIATRSQRLGAFPDPGDAIDPPSGGRSPAEMRATGPVVTSPALAARQTASHLGLTATAEPALRDVDYGRWRGLTLAEIEASAPACLAGWLCRPDARPPDGESLLDLEWRLGPWLDRCSTLAGPLLAVTHPVVIRTAIVLAIGALPGVGLAIDIAPLTRTVLSFQGRWRLQALGLPL